MLKLNKFCISAIMTLIVYTIVLSFYYNKSQENAIEQAHLSTEDLLRNQHAIKTFFNDTHKTNIINIYEDNNISQEKFLPELYSCTYALKEINNYYNYLRNQEDLPPIEITFVSKNPSNIKNITNAKESMLLDKFNARTLNSYSEVLETKKGKYLYFAKPIEPLKISCLECHGKIENAPRILIDKYGQYNGFNYNVGDIKAFFKVLVPLEKYINDAQHLFFLIFSSTLIMLIGIFIILRLYVNKNTKETKKFQTVLDTLDELIIVKSNEKIHTVSKSFLKFFNIKSLKEFLKSNACTSDFMVKKNGYLDINFNDNIESIIDLISKTEKTKRIIMMKDSQGELHTLSIKIDKLETESNLYVIVLSDITVIQKKAELFKKRANIDSLTGAFTRQRFNELYNFEFSRSTRYFSPLSILFLDIDHFKEVNDNYGHDIGDEILKHFTQLISQNIREFDKLARWGGEEFILMLPQTNVNDAYRFAEKIRQIIETSHFDKIKKITCSIGVSMLKKGDDTESLIKRADIGVYKAKNSGRNKTIIEV